MRKLVVGAAVCLLLAACAHTQVVREPAPHRAPTRRAAPMPVPQGGYVVQRGDTLYGIAFRHGLDFRDLAAWNGIPSPYTIYPGQRLRLGGRPLAAKPLPPPKPAPRPAITPRPPPGTSITGMPDPGAARPPATPSPPSRPVATPAPTPAKPEPIAAPVLTAPGRWNWPAEGNLIGRFVAGDPTQPGIDIAGQAGQPVRAAADGVVVYSGTGLVGYGEVIIVKHNDEWLSAYGHNRRRLVAEGEAVKAGQAIAELGRSGTSRDMLHFEIRRNGKPVDPLGLLPSR